MTNVDIRKHVTCEQLMLESLKTIGRREDSPLGNLFPPGKPILK
jgi:hypothetical protein